MARKLLSVLLVLVMLCGIFPSALFVSAAGEPSITIINNTSTPEHTYFEVVCENTDAKDWVCIYHSSQELNKSPHSGWQQAPAGGGTLTFSLEKFESIGGGVDRLKGTPGGWPLSVGEWKVVLYDADAYTTILDIETLNITDPDLEGAVYVSNRYGSDSNNGTTEETAVKTLKKAVELIGTANDGTVVVLDGKDTSGNAEYSVYTRSSDKVNGNYRFGGTQDVLIYQNVPAHTGTIKYIGDAADSVICYGANHMELKGPSVFKNISLIEGYNTGKELITNGHSVIFEKNISFICTAIDNSTDQPANKGLRYTGYTMTVDVSGRNKISLTTPAAITVKEHAIKELAIGGWDNNITIANNQTIYVEDGADISTLKLRNSSGTWSMQDMNIVVNGGKVGAISDAGTGAATATALQIVFNNGITVPYTKTGITLTEGEWLMYAEENEEGMALDVTDTPGTFKVIGDMTALAKDENGNSYVSADGYLTVPAGAYTVNFYENISADSIIVYFDGKASEQTYMKGDIITLPEKDDTFAATFKGWNINGTFYAAGETYTLPTEGFEIEITSVWDAIPGTAVAYVDAVNGNDINSGKTADSAFLTLAKAVQTLDTATEAKKYVVILDTIKVDSAFPAHTSEITYTGGKIHIYKNSIPIGGPTKFENIEFYVDIASKFLETLGNPLTLGENVVCTNTKSTTGLGMHIGTSNADGGKETLTINSGKYGPVFVGAYYNTGSIHKTEGADITVNGGEISEIRFGADGWISGTHLGNEFTENANVTVNGGTVGKITYSSYAPTFKKAFQIILNNGAATTVPDGSRVEGGYWVMRSEASDTSALKPTEKAGEFEVVGTLTAVATAADGAQYVSASGILAVPEGTYDVTYTDVVYYVNNGKEVEFYEDYEIDLNKIRYSDIENKLFIGWTDENGEGVKKNSFKKGEKLYAQYVDCNMAVGGDFAIKGVQIRTKSPAGLRFIVEKSDALYDALDSVAYGTIVMPTEYMGTSPLTLGAKYTYNGKEYSAKTVSGEKIFADTDKGVEYTVCITKIAKANYKRTYTVRGYISYVDLQGNEKILYTDYYSTNLYSVAKEALEDETITDAEREYYTSIKKHVDETMKNEYLSQTKTDIVGTSADPTTWIYQLGDGVMVREVEIDTGKGGDAVEIVQISDTHFNYCNEEDLKDPVLASTWENRRAFRYPGTQTALLNSIEYASYSDQIVLTGDAIDYLSTGCVDLLNKFFWDKYPTALVALGNHEVVKKMQGLVPETTTSAQRYEEIKNYWKHDVYYTEKVLTNDEGVEKVMVIQIDNSQNKFWDHQVPLLEASVAKAKEKNIPILLFAHVPLDTRDPANSSIPAIRVNDSTSSPANFYNGFIGKNATGATKQIYDIITMNPDVFKGYFCGHWHADFYTEIWSKNADGTDNPNVVIPQYALTGSAYEKGHALRITVK